MKIKVGDKVKVITGANKGKEGKILKVLRKENRVIIDGVNLVKKTLKPDNQNQNGGIIEVEAPIHISNIKVVSEKSNKEDKKKAAKKTTGKESK